MHSFCCVVLFYSLHAFSTCIHLEVAGSDAPIQTHQITFVYKNILQVNQDLLLFAYDTQ